MDDFRRHYEEVRYRAMSFDGMTGELSVAVFLALLGLQERNGVTGNVVEYGVFRGRSAAIVLSELRDDEIMIMVDPSHHPELDRLAEICPRFRMFEAKSEAMAASEEFLALLGEGVRFSHHDASHFFQNVTAEMAMTEKCLKPQGLMVLDDFGSNAYLQVIAACFHHLYTTGSDLEVLLHTDNKAYLCRRADFPFYARFVLEELQDILRLAGIDCYLARTENDSRYRAFSLARKRPPQEPERYGLNIWGDRFYRL